jgi:hypothetical protein
LRNIDNMLLGDGRKGVGVEPDHTTARKPGSLTIIQYSLPPPAGSLLCQKKKTTDIERERDGEYFSPLIRRKHNLFCAQNAAMPDMQLLHSKE